MSRFGDALTLPHNLSMRCLTGWYKNFKGLFLHLFVCVALVSAFCRGSIYLLVSAFCRAVFIRYSWHV